MSTYIFSLFNHPVALQLQQHEQFRQGEVKIHTFPDGENRVDILSDIRGQNIIIIDAFDRPNDKIFPLLWFCQTAKELGVVNMGLIATYSPFMRQDAIFTTDQNLSSRSFSDLFEEYIDWFATCEPHLHHIGDLNEIFTIPAHRIHLTELAGNAVAHHFENPIIIGLDAQSRQWAQKIATIAGCDYIVLKKKRRGDRDVTIDIEGANIPPKATPVFVDDIVSSGKSILAASTQLKQLPQKPHLIAMHGIFTENAYQLIETALASIITSNTIPHKSNGIDIYPAIEKICLQLS